MGTEGTKISVIREGVKMNVTFEVYRKSSDKKILEEGPENVHFWVKAKVKKIPVSSLSESHLRAVSYTFLRDVLCLQQSAYLRVITCHYWNSPLRVSYWAWVFTSNSCYKCHAESAFIP